MESYKQAVRSVLQEPGGRELACKVRQRLQNERDRDADEEMRLQVLGEVLDYDEAAGWQVRRTLKEACCEHYLQSMRPCP